MPEIERLSVWNTTGLKRPFLAVRAEAYDALEADRDHLRADLAAAEREAEFLRGELAKAVAAVREAAAPSPPDTDERRETYHVDTFRAEPIAEQGVDGA